MSRLDLFAELLSRDLTIEAIRADMGLSKGAAWRLMRQLRNRMGWQAQ